MPKHNRQRDVYTEGVQYWEAYCDSLNDISGFYNYIGGGKDCNLEECCTIKQSRETQYCSTTYKGRPIYGICCPSSQDNDFCREVHGGLGVFGSSTKSKNGLPGANCNVDTDCKDLYNDVCVSDGSCSQTPSEYGCIDTLACNYNPNATLMHGCTPDSYPNPDYSCCEYPLGGYDCDGEYIGEDDELIEEELPDIPEEGDAVCTYCPDPDYPQYENEQMCEIRCYQQYNPEGVETIIPVRCEPDPCQCKACRGCKEEDACNYVGNTCDGKDHQCPYLYRNGFVAVENIRACDADPTHPACPAYTGEFGNDSCCVNFMNTGLPGGECDEENGGPYCMKCCKCGKVHDHCGECVDEGIQCDCAGTLNGPAFVHPGCIRQCNENLILWGYNPNHQKPINDCVDESDDMYVPRGSTQLDTSGCNWDIPIELQNIDCGDASANCIWIGHCFDCYYVNQDGCECVNQAQGFPADCCYTEGSDFINNGICGGKPKCNGFNTDYCP